MPVPLFTRRVAKALLSALVLAFGISAAADAAPASYSYRVYVPQLRAGATSVPVAMGALSPVTSSDFGQVGTGSLKQLSFTFTNTGTTSALGVQASVTGTALSLSANTCGTAQSPGVVQAGSSCTMTVQYAPVTQGALSNASLTVVSSAQGSPNTLSLSGGAVYVPTSLISTEGLVAYYPFASSAANAVTGGTILYAAGSPSFSATEAPFGASSPKGALVLNGVSGYRNPSTAVISGSGDYSFGTWIKTTSATAGASIVQQRSGNFAGSGDNYGQYYFALISGKVCYTDGNSSALKAYVCSTKLINDGVWHHVGFVRPAAGGLTVYVDGSPVKASYTVQALSAGGGVSFGFDQRDGTAYFTGALRDAWFFNRPVSDAEFAAVAAARAPLVQ